jgi:hypothetical protein
VEAARAAELVLPARSAKVLKAMRSMKAVRAALAARVAVSAAKEVQAGVIEACKKEGAEE